MQVESNHSLEEFRSAGLNWLNQSRGRLQMAPAEALAASAVLSVLLGAILLSVIGGLSSTGRISTDQFIVVESPQGLRCVDDNVDHRSIVHPQEIIGDGSIAHSKERRGYFGPYPIVVRPTPRATIRLDPGHALTETEFAALFETAPSVATAFTPTPITEIAPSYDGDFIHLAFEPGFWSIVWSGVFANLALWAYFLFVCSCFAWFFSSLHRVCDPRRKRARRLAAGRCPLCRYDLRATTSNRCSECGELLTVQPER